MKAIRNLILGAPLILISVVYAQNPPPQKPEAERKAFEACLTELGVKRPEPGKAPSIEEREKMSKCMGQKGFTKTGGGSDAFRECVEKNNLKMPSRENPHSEEDRKKVDACLKEKGATAPQGQARPQSPASAPTKARP
jgi:hypothetical protein